MLGLYSSLRSPVRISCPPPWSPLDPTLALGENQRQVTKPENSTEGEWPPPNHCTTLPPPAAAQTASQGVSCSCAPTVPALVGPRDLASLLGCGVGLRGELEQCWAPYQQLIPSWSAPGLPFSETPTLILTHGVFASESPQP